MPEPGYRPEYHCGISLSRAMLTFEGTLSVANWLRKSFVMDFGPRLFPIRGIHGPSTPLIQYSAVYNTEELDLIRDMYHCPVIRCRYMAL